MDFLFKDDYYCPASAGCFECDNARNIMIERLKSLHKDRMKKLFKDMSNDTSKSKLVFK